MKRREIVMLLFAVVTAAMVQSALAQPASAPALAKALLQSTRYVDELNGFWLYPPAGTERLRETSARRLVAWVKRDQASSAILWTLEVLKAQSQITAMSAEEFAQNVAQQMVQDGFATGKPQLSVIAGRAAMSFRGPWKGMFPRWRGQTWVHVRDVQAPSTFTAPAAATKAAAPEAAGAAVRVYLILDISGPENLQQEMDATLSAVAAGMKLTDPVAAKAERAENLKNGQALLEGLKIQTLRSAIAKDPYCFLLEMQGKPVGAIKLAESIAQPAAGEGLLVRRLGVLKLPDQPAQWTVEEAFCTADRKSEHWKRTSIPVFREEPGKTLTKRLVLGDRTVLEVVKENDRLVQGVTTVFHVAPTQPVRPRMDSKPARKLGEALLGWYLPEAMDSLLPRLIDLKTPAGYGFAIYNAALNDFDLRMLKVLGPESVELGGRVMQAVALSDQMAPDAPTAKLWVNDKGELLKMESADGLTLRRAPAKEVNDLFGQDLLELEKLK